MRLANAFCRYLELAQQITPRSLGKSAVPAAAAEAASLQRPHDFIHQLQRNGLGSKPPVALTASHVSKTAFEDAA